MKIFILKNSNPEELERQFSSWSKGKDICEIQYQMNSVNEKRYEDGDPYSVTVTYYSILIIYNE